MTTTTVRAEDATRGELRRPLPREHRHLRRLTAPARLPASRRHLRRLTAPARPAASHRHLRCLTAPARPAASRRHLRRLTVPARLPASRRHLRRLTVPARLPGSHRHLRRLTVPARLPGSHDCRKARLRNWTRPCCENCSKTTRQHTPETALRSRALANGPAKQRETGNRARCGCRAAAIAWFGGRLCPPVHCGTGH